MYAIIKSGSRQYQVAPETIIEVNRLPLEEGEVFETDQVLLVDQDGKDVQIGSPYVSGAKVKGKILSHRRGRKVIVFKFKRRKNYKRTRGHRQELTRVLIEGIEVGGKTFGVKVEAKKAPAKEEAPKAAEEVAEKAPVKAKAAAKPKESSTEKPSVKSSGEASAKVAADKGSATEKKAPAKEKAAVKKAPAAQEADAKDDQ